MVAGSMLSDSRETWTFEQLCSETSSCFNSHHLKHAGKKRLELQRYRQGLRNLQGRNRNIITWGKHRGTLAVVLT